MSEEKELLGADAAAVEGAGSSAPEAASHAERVCVLDGEGMAHFTAKDGDTKCQCGMVDLLKPVALFDPTSTADRSIAAMAAFATAIKDLPRNEQRAAIYWLADFFLGIKLWGKP